MKKSLTGMVALLAGAFVAHSQGTVSFGNYLNSSYSYVSLKSGSKTTDIGGATGASTGSAAGDVGLGNQWTVQLYGAAGSGDASSALLPLLQQDGITPVTAAMAQGTASTLANPDGVAGTWASTEIGVVPGAAGGAAATLQVYAWYNDGGTITSYSAAKAANVPIGFSSTANLASLGGTPAGGGASSPPAFLPTGTAGLGSFSVTGVPEPSTIALGVMGASAFLLRLRKKQ
jgi:hypothetical protein